MINIPSDTSDFFLSLWDSNFMISECSCPAYNCCLFYFFTPLPVSFNFACIDFLSLSLLYDFWKSSLMASSSLIKSPQLLILMFSSSTEFLFHSCYRSYVQFPFESAFYQVILAFYLQYYFMTFSGCLCVAEIKIFFYFVYC